MFNIYFINKNFLKKMNSKPTQIDPKSNNINDYFNNQRMSKVFRKKRYYIVEYDDFINHVIEDAYSEFKIFNPNSQKIEYKILRNTFGPSIERYFFINI